MSLGDRLKQAREKAGLSPTELASRAQVTTSAISQIESGLTKNIRLGNFFRMVHALHCDPEWLATGKHSGVKEDSADYSALAPRQAELLSLFDFMDEAAQENLLQTATLLSGRLDAAKLSLNMEEIQGEPDELPTPDQSAESA